MNLGSLESERWERGNFRCGSKIVTSNYHIRIYVLPFWNFTTDPKCYTTPTTERQRHLERRVCVGRGWFNALLPNCANKWQSTITFSPSLKAKKVWHCFHSSLVSSAALCTLSVSSMQLRFQFSPLKRTPDFEEHFYPGSLHSITQKYYRASLSQFFLSSQ